MKYILIFLFVVFSPGLTFASSLTKQEACAYPDGIHEQEVYILWRGKFPYAENFLKKDGFLYYFIHTFADKKSELQYRSTDNSDISKIRNTGSYFVSFDCSRSKVKFHPALRSRNPGVYGDILSLHGKNLIYSWKRIERDPCFIPPDFVYDLSTNQIVRFDSAPGIPKSTSRKCVSRSSAIFLDNNTIQFDIEEFFYETQESFYSRYQYYLGTQNTKRIR